ncbi:Uncharacterized protein dnm_056310 [Desulfonema magnum]|uniref:Uncharacterized protein n=1 Tax=Desulfonema magnum TaxID=45655 RepID=A0A975BR67_9BACT|nr:Uncharacterized protein dnm_056310 [Desulfonema magnum]
MHFPYNSGMPPRNDIRPATEDNNMSRKTDAVCPVRCVFVRIPRLGADLPISEHAVRRAAVY